MIHQLSEETIKKIAAGEVIERPVSVIKELIENAIDAGATRISIRMEDGGKTRMSVSDNGSGIPQEEMETAFLPHATSKIQDFHDLYQLHSLGFRGEALASIIAVADVSAASKTESDAYGLELKYEDGKCIQKEPIAMHRGTRMEVRNLFGSIPVRQKFMKSDVAEGNRISRFVETMAIAYPNIGFRLDHGSRRILSTAEGDTLKDRLLVLYGRSYYEALQEVDGANEQYHLSGVIGNNTFYRANRQMQFLFVNGRAVEDERIRRAVEDCFRSIIPNGRFPAFQLFLATDPENLDVNIHPNKMSLHFAGADALETLVHETIRQALFQRPQLPGETQKAHPSLFSELSAEESYQKILSQYSWSETMNSPRPDAAASHEESSHRSATEEMESGLDLILEEEELPAPRDMIPEQIEIPTTENTTENLSLFNETEASPLPPLERMRWVGTLFHVYILFEDAAHGTIYLMDQHAAHERVNYERFCKQFKTHAIVTQQLLTPIVLSLTPEEMSAYQARSELLSQLGFSHEWFGDQQVILRAVPTLIKSKKDEVVFRDLITLPLHDWSEYDHLVDQLAMQACKASVKQGDALTPEEIRQLYADLRLCEYPLTCPHGRPTVITRTKGDLEKWFLRIK